MRECGGEARESWALSANSSRAGFFLGRRPSVDNFTLSLKTGIGEPEFENGTAKARLDPSWIAMVLCDLSKSMIFQILEVRGDSSIGPQQFHGRADLFGILARRPAQNQKNIVFNNPYCQCVILL